MYLSLKEVLCKAQRKDYNASDNIINRYKLLTIFLFAITYFRTETLTR